LCEEKPKESLTTLEPKGKWSGMGASNSSIVDDEPPAERSDLTHTNGTHAKRGKPVPSNGHIVRESKPRDLPTGLRVKDAGKSECRFVMKRIGIQNLPHAKAEQTSNAGGSLRENAANYLRRESRWRR